MTQKTNPVTPLASPLGEEGHEVAKGWTVVRMIMMGPLWGHNPRRQPRPFFTCGEAATTTLGPKGRQT